MKKTLIICLFLLSGFQAFSQTPVIDVGVISTLVFNHTVQQATLNDIKDSEGEIAAAQKVIAVKMEQIRALEEKVYTSLKTVQAAVKDAKNIVYAGQIVTDIGEYQSKMFQLAGEDPELTIVAAKTQLALVNRTTDLMLYIAQATVPGDVNLLNNKQRHDMINHVVTELRVMRGIAYGITRKMLVAKRAGILKTLNPLKYDWPDNGAAIVEELLADFKVN